MRDLNRTSNQFPNPQKRKPVSFSLLYNGEVIPSARLCPYAICTTERLRLSQIGWEYGRFKIIYNY